ISPEQAQGIPADARADLYALGVLLWEMLVGEKPFSHDDPVDTLRDHISTPAPPVRARAPKTAAALEALVMRLLQKSPAARYQSAGGRWGVVPRGPEVTAAAPPPRPPGPPRPGPEAPAASVAPVAQAAPAASLPLAAWQLGLGLGGAVLL